MNNAVKILDMTDDAATVGGYGVLFGGVDLDGETFTADTDYRMDLVPTKLVFYDHMAREVKHQLGTVGNDNIKADDKGIWIEAQLNRSVEYVNEVLKLVEKGVLGWSSGSVAHLTQRAEGVIKSWPIVEFSLTPTPAEARTLGVERIKALARLDPSLKALVPETGPGNPVVENATTAGESAILTDEINQETKSMTEITREEIGDVVADNLAKYDEMKAAAEKSAAEREAELQAARDEAVAAFKSKQTADNDPGPAKAVNLNTVGIGNDTEVKAFENWARTGDANAAMKASNDSTWNITTDADGGYAVPTDHFQGIVARRDESMIANTLGVRRFTGTGTTINVPVDNEDNGEFVSTSESGAYDRDQAALTQVALTLVKYTKKIDITVELLQDEDSNLMPFIEDFVGRGMAKTHNNLLITETAANGTSLKTFASATVIAVDELEDITYNDAIEPYLDDTASSGWAMRRSVHGEIVKLDDTSIRRYANNQQGDERRPDLLGFPVNYTIKSGATAASAKSVHFGNWNYVGLYEAPAFTVIRDPYSRAGNGEVIFHYMFRADYGVLVAEAIGYGVHPSA
jgi:HK97 family phage major capsid protein